MVPSPAGFQQVLSGRKANLEVKANKVYGNLIKWKEGNKIGSGSSGVVHMAQNIKTCSIFAVKKLQFISATSGIDKEAIFKQKVSSCGLIGVERDRGVEEVGPREYCKIHWQ